MNAKIISTVFLTLFLLSSCSAQKTSGKESDFDQPVITKGVNTKLESVNQLVITDKKWKIGQIVDDEIMKRANINLTGNFFEVKIGDLKGLDENETQIGWNNQNRIVYVSTTHSDACTIDRIGIGSTRQEIMNALGTPYLSTSTRLRYQNLEYELQGIVFYFSGDIVTRIVIFAGI